MSVFQGLILVTMKIPDSHKNQIFSKLFASSTVSTQINAYCELYLTLHIQDFY